MDGEVCGCGGPLRLCGGKAGQQRVDICTHISESSLLSHHFHLPQEMCSMFWPLKMSEPKTFGSIKVCLDNKAEQASYNKYHLAVSFTVRTCCIHRAWT